MCLCQVQGSSIKLKALFASKMLKFHPSIVVRNAQRCQLLLFGLLAAVIVGSIKRWV